MDTTSVCTSCETQNVSKVDSRGDGMVDRCTNCGTEYAVKALAIADGFSPAEKSAVHRYIVTEPNDKEFVVEFRSDSIKSMNVGESVTLSYKDTFPSSLYSADSGTHYEIDLIYRGALSGAGIQVGLSIFFFFVASMFYVMAQGALERSASLHWIVGVVVATLLVLLTLVVLGLVWKSLSSRADALIWFGRYFAAGALGVLMLVILVAMAAMATVSFNLMNAGLLEYTSSQEIAYGRLIDYYGWHVIDSIPVLNLWKTFGVEQGIVGVGFGPGILLLSFRVLIVAAGIFIVQKAIRMQRPQLRLRYSLHKS